MTFIDINEEEKQVAAQRIKNLREENTRKRAYISSLGINSLAKFLIEEGLNPDDSDSLHAITKLLEDFEIADISVNNVKIDIRVIFGEEFNELLIPKSHKEYGISPDLYACVRINKELNQSEILGYYADSNLKSAKESKNYYIIPTSELTPISELKAMISLFEPKEYSFGEEESVKAKELILSYVDGDISKEDKVFLVNHMVANKSCRDALNLLYNLEAIYKEVRNDPAFVEDMTLKLFAGNFPAQKEEVVIPLGEEKQEKGNSVGIAPLMFVAPGPPAAFVPMPLSYNDGLKPIFDDEPVSLPSFASGTEAPSTEEKIEFLSYDAELKEFSGFELSGEDEPIIVSEDEFLVESAGDTLYGENAANEEESGEIEFLSNETEQEERSSFELLDEDEPVIAFGDELLVESEPEDLTEESPENAEESDEIEFISEYAEPEELSGFELSDEDEPLVESEDELLVESESEDLVEESPEESDEIEFISEDAESEDLLGFELSSEDELLVGSESENLVEESPENAEESDDIEFLSEETESEELLGFELSGEDEIQDLSQELSLEENSEPIVDESHFEDESPENDEESAKYNIENSSLPLEGSNDDVLKLEGEESAEQFLFSDDAQVTKSLLEEILSDSSHEEDSGAADISDEDLLKLISEDYDESGDSSAVEQSSSDALELLEEVNLFDNDTLELMSQDDFVDLPDEYKEVKDPGVLELLFDENKNNGMPNPSSMETDEEQVVQKSESKKKTLQIAAAIALAGILSTAGISYVYKDQILASFYKNDAVTQQDLLPQNGSNSEGVSPMANQQTEGVTPVNNNQSAQNLPMDASQSMPAPVQPGDPNQPAQIAPVTPAPVHKETNFNDAIAKAVLSEHNAVRISKVSWEIGSSLAGNQVVNKYLNFTGRAIKLNLSQDLLFAKDRIFSETVKVGLEYNKNGTPAGTTMKQSSGSKEIDEIILKTVNDTLQYAKMPEISTNKPKIKVTLIINL